MTFTSVAIDGGKALAIDHMGRIWAGTLQSGRWTFDITAVEYRAPR